MKKLINFIQTKIDKYVINRYRKIAENELQITTKEIEVKKGKIKYILLVIQDRNLKTIFNLGRHFEQEPKIR